MKLFVLLFIAAFCVNYITAYVNSTTPKYADSKTKCMKELKIATKPSGEAKNASDPSLKCMKRCMLVKLGTIFDTVEPNYVKIGPKYNSTAVMCNNIAKVYAKKNDCRRANRFDKCMVNHEKKKNAGYVDECANINYSGNGSCTQRCMLLTMSIVDENGMLQPSLYQNMPKIYQSAVTSCNGQYSSASKCDKPVQRYNCYNTKVFGNAPTTRKPYYNKYDYDENYESGGNGGRGNSGSGNGGRSNNGNNNIQYGASGPQSGSPYDGDESGMPGYENNGYGDADLEEYEPSNNEGYENYEPEPAPGGGRYGDDDDGFDNGRDFNSYG